VKDMSRAARARAGSMAIPSRMTGAVLALAAPLATR